MWINFLINLFKIPFKIYTYKLTNSHIFKKEEEEEQESCFIIKTVFFFFWDMNKVNIFIGVNIYLVLKIINDRDVVLV